MLTVAWRFVVVLFFCGLSFTAQAQSEADRSQARTLYYEGQEHLNASRWARACDVLAQSNALIETAETHHHLASCSGELGRLLDQSEHLRAFVRMAGPHIDPDKITEANATIATLQPQIPAVVPNVQIASSHILTLTIAGETVPRAAWGSPRPVNPGPVLVRAMGAGYQPFSETVQVQPGERLEVSVELIPTPRPEVTSRSDGPPIIVQNVLPERDEPQVSRGRPALIVTLVLVLAAGAGVGAYFLLRDNEPNDADSVHAAVISF